MLRPQTTVRDAIGNRTRVKGIYRGLTHDAVSLDLVKSVFTVGKREEGI